jgi:hypothetical protein
MGHKEIMNFTTFRLGYFTIVALTALVLSACAPSADTSELDADIAALKDRLSETEMERSQYSGGAIVSLIETRRQYQLATLAALEMKRKSLVHFIMLEFKVSQEVVGGALRAAPPGLLQDIARVEREIADAEGEAERYSGGLLRALALTQVKTLQVTHAGLEMKRLNLKWGIPYFQVEHENSGVDREQMEYFDDEAL